MSHFIQLHSLISYPPANLNRDDTGQPKTARMGGAERLRVSSQSLKRAWRTSETFQQQLAGHIGTRTKNLGVMVFNKLTEEGIKEKDAKVWASKIAAQYGKLKTDKGKELELEQLVHVSPEEFASLDRLTAELAFGKRAPTQKELDALLHTQHAVDIAMFGRMLAGKPGFSGEAAVQVAHAIGVHASAVEDDYFTAIDDLNSLGQADSGAAHIGESGFAAAVFYQYICIDRDLLLKNLGGDEMLTQKTLRILIETALTVGPSGKQNSYASRAYAHFALVEKGCRQPRSLSLAFLKPVSGTDYGHEAVTALARVRRNMDAVYGPCAASCRYFDVFDVLGAQQNDGIPDAPCTLVDLADLAAFAAASDGFGD